MTTPVVHVPAADSSVARAHFEARLGFETDCWDVHESLAAVGREFVLVDVRSPALYARSHLPGAINIPHAKIVEGTMKRYAPETLFVVYCAGPHCNGANKAAVRLARLGRPVKEMIGGMTGWADEGFEFACAEGEPSVA